MHEKTKRIVDTITKYITYYISIALITGCIGFVIGFKTCKYIINQRIEESIMVGGFIHKGKVYEIKERIFLNKN